MADLDYAIAWTLGKEGRWSNDPLDRGGRTAWGITERLASRYGYDVALLTQDQARRIYRDEFWQPLRLDEVASRYVAAEIFDTAVNMGPYWAVRIAQDAVHLIGAEIHTDGKMGPATIAALNAWSKRYEPHLLYAMQGYQFVRYVTIFRNDPEHSRAFVRGWMLRLEVPNIPAAEAATATA